jgi:hypothetical protein
VPLPFELVAFVLKTVNIPADVTAVAHVAPDELTDEQLKLACSSTQGRGGDIILLTGCAQLNDMSSLAELEQMQVLNIFGCHAMDAVTLAKVINEHK